jgi:GTPase Era involved in 16S rRNA processing
MDGTLIFIIVCDVIVLLALWLKVREAWQQSHHSSSS